MARTFTFHLGSRAAYRLRLFIESVAVFGLLFVSAGPARAETNVTTNITTVPIFSQKLSFEIEKGWKPAWQSPKNPSSYSLEIIPENETVENWTQMITVSGFKGMAAMLSVEQASKLEADSIRGACPNHFVSTTIPTTKLQGYDTYKVIMGCTKHPQLKEKNEIALFTFVKGKADMYFLKKSFHEPVTASGAPQLNEKTYEKLASEVATLKMCKNDGQGPTCAPEDK